jgi:uncharacterized surface protein with fasciclin (FAS1) repeats
MKTFFAVNIFHVLVGVLLFAPLANAEEDAYSVMRGYGNFDAFCDLIERADLVDAFKVEGPITVFAPDDRAVDRMGPEERAILDDAGRLPELRALVLYHIVDRKLSAFDLKQEKPRATIGGKQVKLVDMGGYLLINDAYIDTADIPAANGLIHAIDKVLVPPQ